MAVAAVVAVGDDAGKPANLGRTRKEIDAVAYLGLAKAGRVLQWHADMRAGRVGGWNILVQAAEVVDARGGLDGGPVPLQPGPFHARGRDPSLVPPDRETVGAGIGRVGTRRRLEPGEPQQAQQEIGRAHV